MVRNWTGPGRCWILWIVLIGRLSRSVLAQSNGTILREGFDLQRCGVPRLSGLRSRITEGELAMEGHWPWHGGLFHLDEYQCGCTLINELFVLTASHCVYNSGTGYKLSESILRIKLGMYRLSANDTDRTQVYTVRSILSHTKYMTSSHKHDVALVRLNETVQFTDYIQPVCLDLTESIWVEHLADVLGTVVGWGITEKNRVSDQLVKAEIPIIRYTDCVEQDPSTYGPLIYSGMYCAGILNGTSPCNGDSGGGMYIYRENRWFLRGVVSFARIRAGTNFCDSFSYVVFMNVPYYTKWISTEVEAARESLRLEATTPSPKTNVSSRWDSELAENDALEETFFPAARMDTEGESSSPYPRRTARCGQNVTLSCVRPSNSILSYRRDVRWYKSINGRRELLASKALLRLQPVRRQDAGEYWCTTTARSGQLLESGMLLEVSDVPLRFRQNGESKSYASYATPTRTGFSITQFSFEMTFRTTEADGLLFHKPALPDLESWSYSLSLERSRLTFRMVPPGQGEKVFRTVRLNLEPARWMTVLVSCYDGHGFLALDGQYLLGFEGHLLQHRLDRYYIANDPDLLEAVNSGLSGCVSRVAVNEQELRLLEDAIENDGVKLCDDCPTGGCRDVDGTVCPVEQISCINYACSDGRCDRTDAFSPERTCDFRLGTDADGLRFLPNSYASYRSFLSATLTVELQFRLRSLQDGIVLHTAEHRRGYGKFITVLFKAGRIELRFTTDAHLTTTFMESEVPLAVGRWHLLRAGYANGYVYLQVDGERKVERSVAGKLVSPERQLVVFVGGVRWKGFINRHRDVWRGLDGCIKGLKLSGLPVDMVDDMVESANVQRC